MSGRRMLENNGDMLMKKTFPPARWVVLLGATLLLLTAGCDRWSDDSGSDGGGSGDQGEGGGFLWKPVGENSGRLVILLPPQYTGKAGSVHVASGDGQVLDVGVYTGVGNGGRTHWRFPQKGGAYGNNILAVADLNAGGSVHWPIPSGAARVEY